MVERVAFAPLPVVVRIQVLSATGDQLVVTHSGKPRDLLPIRTREWFAWVATARRRLADQPDLVRFDLLLFHGVVFYLGDIFRQHQEFTVTAVTVREEQSDGSTRAVWSAEGAQRLRYIAYGATYPDLKESQRPLRLRSGKRYEVFVYTSTGAKSLDVFAFRVDENGNVRQVPWLRI